jgi:hypothetical protein
VLRSDGVGSGNAIRMENVNAGGFDGSDTLNTYYLNGWTSGIDSTQFEILGTITNPPTNTKLLNINNVTFNVETTSASVD